MSSFLRQIYVELGAYSTKTQRARCKDLLQQLEESGRDNLAAHFSDALKLNETFCQIERPFIPGNRSGKAGTNPVAAALARQGTLTFPVGEASYAFTFCGREIPHLRVTRQSEQINKGWIDYVGCTQCRPVLGEIKWKGDKTPFYAFIQLLMYLSEIATPNQINRCIKHKLFSDKISQINAFDLHILLVNFNDGGEKRKLIAGTEELATAFKRKLARDHPEAASVLGDILCLSTEMADPNDRVASIRCRWSV